VCAGDLGGSVRKQGVRLALSATLALGIAVIAVPAAGDETTIAYGPMRTAWDQSETHLGPADVQSADFGQLFSTTLPRPAGQTATTYPNQIYAQPLVADGEVIVATEENQVDALNPITGALIWSVNLGPAWTPTNCGDLVPHIGITSTPVYDPSTKRIYLGAKIANGPSGAPNFYLYALDADTGATVSGWPVQIKGVPTNSSLTFNAATANQRPGLLLLDGAVYLGFASHCDHGPYVGYVAGVNVATRTLKLWSDESQLATDEAGIWQSGGGLVSDGSGRIFLATGNGVSPPPGPGTSPPGTLAESVVRLAVNSDGSMTAKDFFSPSDNVKLDQNDTDLGSGGPVALPDVFGTASHPHLLVIVGKDGVVRLLDRDNLGGMGQGAGGTDKVVSSIQLNGVWGRAAVFASGTNRFIYLVPNSSPMQVLRVAPDGNGNPSLSVAATSGALSFPYTSGSPVVTSDGTNSSTALVWTVRSGGGSSGTSSTLYAFPAVPPASGPWNPIFQASLGTVAKFIAPATDGNRVYVGTRDGRLLGFGRPVQSALIAPETDFGLEQVNTTSPAHPVTVTAQSTVTVSTVSATAPFAAGSPSVSLPHTFTAGQTFTVPVTFTPTAAGTANGALQVTLSTNAAYQFALTGTGTENGLVASPMSLDFGTVTAGSAKVLGVTILNTGTSPATIQSVTPPVAPFSVTGLPAVGSVIAAQQSVTVTVRYSPTQPSNPTDAGNLQIDADTGTVTVAFTGTATAGSPVMTFQPASLAFGQVQPGQRKTLTLTLKNTGTATLLIAKAAVPSFPFLVPTPLPEGQSLAVGDSISVQVTAAPATALGASDAYVITGNDGQGAHSVPISVNTGAWVGHISTIGKCLRISGSVANGSPAVAYTCESTSAENFSVGSGNTVHLGQPTSGWCLDVRSSGTTAGTPVQLYHCNGTAAQVWQWRSDSTLYNPHSGKCLNVPSTANGVHLQIAICHVTNSQYWNLAAIVASRGEISSGVGAQYQLCLTDRGGSGAANTPMLSAPCTLSSAQLFVHWGHTLRIFGACVGVIGTGSQPAVGLVHCTGARSQLWDFPSNGTVRNAATLTCLTVPGNVLTPDTPLVVSACGSASGQRWTVP
jgi:hypothetical protein